jgi:hypothetical protein
MNTIVVRPLFDRSAVRLHVVRKPKRWAFSLRFLFLATTFTAGCCWLIAVLSVFGVMLSILMMSAFARTCVQVRRCTESGIVLSAIERTDLFLVSLFRMIYAVFFVLAVAPLLGLLIIWTVFVGWGPVVVLVLCGLLAFTVQALLVKMVSGVARLLRVRRP